MNREIKFNCWVPDLKIMLHGVTVYGNGMVGIDDNTFTKAIAEKEYTFDGDAVFNKEGAHLLNVLTGEDWIYLENEDVILLQYSGLKDKSGKEIYDSDIVLRTDEVAKIFFNSSMAAFDFEMLGGDCEPMVLTDGWHPEAHTVIGNIYENEDLLK